MRVSNRARAACLLVGRSLPRGFDHRCDRWILLTGGGGVLWRSLRSNVFPVRAKIILFSGLYADDAAERASAIDDVELSYGTVAGS